MSIDINIFNTTFAGKCCLAELRNFRDIRPKKYDTVKTAVTSCIKNSCLKCFRGLSNTGFMIGDTDTHSLVCEILIENPEMTLCNEIREDMSLYYFSWPRKYLIQMLKTADLPRIKYLIGLSDYHITTFDEMCKHLNPHPFGDISTEEKQLRSLKFCYNILCDDIK